MASLEIDLTTFIDEIVERIVNALRPAVVAPAEPNATSAVEIPQPMSPEPPAATDKAAKARATQDATRRTCEICGRVGSRRFVPVADIADDRWKCSPTATACAPQFKQPGQYTPPALAPVPTAPPVVDPPPPRPRPAGGPDVTARCHDCSRVWTLTGRVLQMAADTHELKHSHIVEIFEAQEANSG